MQRNSVEESTISERFSEFLAGLTPDALPEDASAIVTRNLIDATGLIVAARNTDYIAQVLASCDSTGPCTAIGHDVQLDAASAALVNGVAIHGEDFDDTLEGAPIRVGAMVIPAVLAAARAVRPGWHDRHIWGLPLGLKLSAGSITLPQGTCTAPGSTRSA